MLIYKSGAIIISRDNPIFIALLYRANHDDWSFPKGHIEKNESPIEAAKREVLEETGLSVRLISDDLPLMEYTHPNGDKIIVYMFLMQSQDDGNLKAEFNGDKIIWVPYREVANKLSYLNTREYFTAVSSVFRRVIESLN
jgi:8-oxo-dGTP pyrophosphatase MutT (NUDIX family)